MANISRRAFMLTASATTTALVGCDGDSMALETPQLGPGPALPLQAAPVELPRAGIIGLGARGEAHCRMLGQLPGVEIAAVCDIDRSRMENAAAILQAMGAPAPTLHGDYREMLDNHALDLVVVVTPWEDHTPMCMSALDAGAHVATEVPAAISLKQCWDLVAKAESARRHCIMLENVNYGRAELTLLNMVRQGRLGEINYCEGGYEHDLRAERFDPARHNPSFWRLKHAQSRNANLYPTHGLGPLANYLRINRGDRFVRLRAFSSPAVGLNRYAATVPPENPFANASFACGDYVVAVLQTHRGIIVYLTFNTSSPRPYSRRHLVQGSLGVFQGYPDRIHLDGTSPYGAWEDPSAHFPPYKPRLWQEWDGGRASEFTYVGHGGDDNIMWLRLVELLRGGQPMDMDVYDAAVLSAVTELTEISLSNNGASVDFPDFTRGRWQEWAVQDYGLA
jgi:predicted dehydrogenase